MYQLSSAIILMLSLSACGREESISEINSISEQGNRDLDAKGDPRSVIENNHARSDELPRRDELNDESALPPMATTGTILTGCYLLGEKVLCAHEENNILDDAELTYRLEIKLFAGDEYISGSHYDVKILAHHEWLFKIELRNILVEYTGGLTIEMCLVEVYPDGYENILSELVVKQRV